MQHDCDTIGKGIARQQLSLWSTDRISAGQSAVSPPPRAPNLSQKASSRAMTSRRSRRCPGADNQQAKERCADAQSPQQPFHEQSERNSQGHKRKPHEQTLSSGFGGPVAAQTAPRPSLTVTPSSPVNVSGPEGGPFSPRSIQYRVSASTGTIRFAITVPFWLRADPRIGTVGTDSVTVTLSLNPQASKLSAQAYEAPVTRSST